MPFGVNLVGRYRDDMRQVLLHPERPRTREFLRSHTLFRLPEPDTPAEAGMEQQPA